MVASLKTLTNFKVCSVSRIRISLRDFLFSHWLIFFGIYSSIFRITDGFQNNFWSHRLQLESLKKLPEEGYRKVFHI
jgi:hypothetical protein